MNLKNLVLITLVIALFGVSIALANQENIITIKLFTVNTSNNPNKINETLILKEGRNINLEQDTLNKTITINANVSNTQTNYFDTIYVNEINKNTSSEIELKSDINLISSRYFYTNKPNSYIHTLTNKTIINMKGIHTNIENIIDGDDTYAYQFNVYDKSYMNYGYLVFYMPSYTVDEPEFEILVNSGATWNSTSFIISPDYAYISSVVKIYSLSGTGNAYVCVDSNGVLYRSTSPCV